jgi:citronellyl-CoA synthetase
MGDTFRWKGENVSTMEVEKIVNAFAQVEQSTAYGVKFRGQDGRLGMVTLVPSTNPEEFDLAGFGRLLVNALPAYAVPRFLRLTAGFNMTQTFKIKKNPLKDQGFDITKVNDPMFVILPGDEVYQPLTQELYSDIKNGVYRF